MRSLRKIPSGLAHLFKNEGIDFSVHKGMRAWRSSSDRKPDEGPHDFIESQIYQGSVSTASQPFYFTFVFEDDEEHVVLDEYRHLKSFCLEPVKGGGFVNGSLYIPNDSFERISSLINTSSPKIDEYIESMGFAKVLLPAISLKKY